MKFTLPGKPPILVETMPLPLRDDKQGAARLLDDARFLRSWIEKPLVMGAVTPSGRALARTMAAYVDPDATGPVVELGPGTGPVTEALVARGVPPERLVLVEYNADFVPLLEARFPGVTVVQGDAYAARRVLSSVLKEPASAIVSSLPLLTKPVEMRLALLDDCCALAAPGAPFVQFTYGLSPPIPRDPERRALTASPRIWWNLPPAQVWIYRSLAE